MFQSFTNATSVHSLTRTAVPCSAFNSSTIASRVGIGPRSTGGGFGLQVWLDLRTPDIPAEEARELMLRADQRCPYSNAIRGNVVVALSVNGQPV